MEFIYLVLFRFLSGLQNGLGYGRYQSPRFGVTLLMLIALIFTVICVERSTSVWPMVFMSVLALVSVVGTLGVDDHFNDAYSFFARDLHFWEILATGGITLAWVPVDGNLLLIICSVYPGLILHKAAINVIPRLRDMPVLQALTYFFDHRTDDATGRTFSLPLLGWKVPRLSRNARILLAVVSVIAALVIAHFRWVVTWRTVVGWL